MTNTTLQLVELLLCTPPNGASSSDGRFTFCGLEPQIPQLLVTGVSLPNLSSGTHEVRTQHHLMAIVSTYIPYSGRLCPIHMGFLIELTFSYILQRSFQYSM